MFVEKEYELTTFFRHIKETADSENDNDYDEKKRHKKLPKIFEVRGHVGGKTKMVS